MVFIGITKFEMGKNGKNQLPGAPVARDGKTDPLCAQRRHFLGTLTLLFARIDSVRTDSERKGAALYHTPAKLFTPRVIY